MYTKAKMPKYKCHKEVRALQIRDIVDTRLYFDEGYPAHDVGPEWIERHNPEIDGYFVQYEDGYTSYSPAKAFESGYSLSPE